MLVIRSIPDQSSGKGHVEKLIFRMAVPKVCVRAAKRFISDLVEEVGSELRKEAAAMTFDKGRAPNKTLALSTIVTPKGSGGVASQILVITAEVVGEGLAGEGITLVQILLHHIIFFSSHTSAP